MEYLKSAEKKLNNHPNIKILQLSQIYETEPWHVHEGENPESGQDWFLNQVLKIETSLSPEELLHETQTIEMELGRSEKGTMAPREIDIDILIYDTDVIDSDHLQIPHRHMTDRQFILIPLLEIEPELKDPVSGRPYQGILDDVEEDHKVTPFL